MTYSDHELLFMLFSEAEKEKVRVKVEKAFYQEEARAKEFGVQNLKEDGIDEGEDKPQPNIFRGTLKGYQIKGMTWLVNLYDQVGFI